MGCGCKKVTPSAAQQKRQAERLAARETRQQAVQKFQQERQIRIQNQRRRPQSS